MWGGLKGAVPILLGALAVLAAVDDARYIYELIFVVVAFSVLVQGSSIPWAARRLGVRMRTREPEPWRLSIDLPTDPGDLHRHRVRAGSYAAGRKIKELPLGDGWIVTIVRDGEVVRPGRLIGARGRRRGGRGRRVQRRSGRAPGLRGRSAVIAARAAGRRGCGRSPDPHRPAREQRLAPVRGRPPDARDREPERRRLPRLGDRRLPAQPARPLVRLEVVRTDTIHAGKAPETVVWRTKRRLAAGRRRLVWRPAALHPAADIRPPADRERPRREPGVGQPAPRLAQGAGRPAAGNRGAAFRCAATRPESPRS